MLGWNTDSAFILPISWVAFLSKRNFQRHELVKLKIVEIMHKSSTRNKRKFVADLSWVG